MARTYRRRLHCRLARRCGATGKVSFRSTTAAWMFVENLEYWNGDTARVYRCPHCDWIHLTSEESRWLLGRMTG